MGLVLCAKYLTSPDVFLHQEIASVLLCTLTELRQSSPGGIALVKQNQFFTPLLEHSAHMTYLIDSLNET